jgi:hypothetical protein
MFTLENVFNKREEFEKACISVGACIEEYSKLIESKTEEDFMEVIYNNFKWINVNIDEFETKFDNVNNFSDGFACVRLGDKWGFIDKSGKYLVEPKFDYVYCFNESFAGVRLVDKWGFIDKSGKYVVEPKFDDAFSFLEGFAGVKLGSKWGFIDKSGKYVVEPKFDEVYSFRGGFLVKFKNGFRFKIKFDE